MRNAGEMVMDRARGQWRSILQSAGVNQRFLTGKNQPCPFCGGEDRFQYTNHEQNGWFHCRNCGAGDGWEFVSRYHKISKKDALARVRDVLGIARRDRQKPSSDYGRKIVHDLWNGAIEITAHDPVGLYLASRNINLSVDPVSLKFHPSVAYFDGKERLGQFPAMLAAFSVGDDYSLQITYLTEDGNRRDDVPTSRKNSAGQMPKGGAVKIYGTRGDTIGVAEGVETALSAAKMDQIPVWACLSAQGLSRWEPPENIKNVIIFGDNDASFTGQKYSYALAHRLKNMDGIDADVRLPDDVGDDWNDVLIGMKR